MGRWGPKIFQNGISGTVKETYLGNLKMGKSDEDAFVQTINKMSEQIIRGLTDEIDMWLALASVMFDYGRLNDVAKETALKYIDDPQELDRWLGKSRSERIKVFDELRAKLNSQQPDRKEIRVLKKIEPTIRPSEIYYFELNKDNLYYKLAVDEVLYVLVLVDSWCTYDFRVNGLGDQHPVVYLKICKKLPANTDELDRYCFWNWNAYNFTHEIETDDKRLIMKNEGFSKMRKRLVRLFDYEFSRDPKENRKPVYEMAVSFWENIDMEICRFIGEIPGSDRQIN